MNVLSNDTIDSVTIQRLVASNSSGLSMKKVVARSDIVVKGATISDLSIHESFFKASLSFIDCRFIGDVSISKTRFAGTLSFLQCEFFDDVRCYDLAIKTDLRIVGSRLKGELSIEGSSSRCIELDKTSVEALTIASSEKSEVSKILLNQIRTININISNVDNVSTFEIRDLSCQALMIKQMRFAYGANIDIRESRITDVNVQVSCFPRDSTLRVYRCTLVNLRLDENSYKTCHLIVNKTQVSGTFSLQGVAQIESFFDLAGSSFAKVDLDDSLLLFIRGCQGHAPLLKGARGSIQRIDTLRILKNAFFNEHDSDMEDRCYYLLKNEEATLHREGASPLVKAWFFLGYLACRYAFGWGVRIINPIVTASMCILLGSVYYYFALGLYEPSRGVEYLGQTISGTLASLMLSSLTFFGQYSSASWSGHISVGFLMAEFLVGLVMTTLLIGMMIRKLVR